MRHSVGITRLAALLLLAACKTATGPRQQLPPPCTFANPLAPGADPWVVRQGGSYYMAQSRDGGIWVSKSSRLSEVPRAAGIRVWTPPDTGWNRTNIWAPELHFINGRWYIYYAAGRAGPPFLYQRAGVLESVSDDPQGAYVDKGMLYTGDSIQTASVTSTRWAIDLTVGQVNGQTYAVWSGWEQEATTDRTPQHLYIARMANPWTIATNRVKLSSPTEPWERRTEPDGLELQEGPEFLRNGTQTFIIYSTHESWLQFYQLGQLRLTSPDADPMSPDRWVKSGPVFAGTGDVYGVGHASFTTSPDGTQNWIVYHSKVSTTPGWDRVIRMQPFDWNADGSPHFGTPVPSGVRIPLPSGECS